MARVPGATDLPACASIDNVRLREGIEVRPSDSRANSYIAEYGERCWETDILPAAVIEQAIDDHINGWLDAKLWRRRESHASNSSCRN